MLLEVVHEVEEMVNTTIMLDQILRENITLMLKKMEKIIRKGLSYQEVVLVAEV